MLLPHVWKFGALALKQRAKLKFEQGLLKSGVVGWHCRLNKSNEDSEHSNHHLNRLKDACNSKVLFQTVSFIKNALLVSRGGSAQSLGPNINLKFNGSQFGFDREKSKKTKEVQEKMDAGEDVPQKKKKTTRSANAATKQPAESENGSTATAVKAKRGKAAAARKESSESENGTASKPKPKSKKTKAADKEEPEASENGTTKTAKGRKAKTKPEDEPGTSKAASKPTRAARAKKEAVEETEEVPAASKAPAKGKKRQAAKAKEEEDDDDDLEPEKKPKGTTRTNVTETNWEAVDFSCTSKTPSEKSPNFRITSWNVDGIRAWMKKGGLDILKYGKPDILCLQETKCSEEKLPEELSNIEGYEAIWCSSQKEGYAGVGILSKVKPLSVIHGINSEEHDEEGRCITAEFENFYLVNVYVPNAGRKLVTLPKRLDWNELFKEFVKNLDEKKPVIVCGDMNVAHTEIDLANPKTNTKNAGFTVEERKGMTDFLEDGFVDSFRKLYPDKEKAYTFWTYMANARAKNTGWRLDYFIVAERFMENVCDNVILHDVFGSDHCPITLHINV